jgi:hypothetical protein
MSKNKKGNKDKSGVDSSGAPTVSSGRKPRVKRSFVERLVAAEKARWQG